jgi:hypothetical protein
MNQAEKDYNLEIRLKHCTCQHQGKCWICQFLESDEAEPIDPVYLQIAEQL